VSPIPYPARSFDTGSFTGTIYRGGKNVDESRIARCGFVGGRISDWFNALQR
jgi:hypothetical protein